MKHAIPALALFTLIFAGCGKETPPAPPAPAPDPVATAPAAPKDIVHELDAAKHEIPAQPVSGRLAGNAFKPDLIELNGNILTFRRGSPTSPDTQLTIIIQPALPADMDYRSVTRAEQKITDQIPSINLFTNTGGQLKSIDANEGYALTLELGKPERSIVKGKIHLSLPGGAKDVIAGTFTVTRDRDETAPPGNDDKPFITGAITATAAPGTTLSVGYVLMPMQGREPIYDTINATFPEAGAEFRAERSHNNKPISVTVRPVNQGKAIEYDITKLPPGKYLVAVRVEGGIPAWSIQEVKPDAVLTIPFVLPTSGAGNVEIDVPGLREGELVQVQALPAEADADDPNGFYVAYARTILGSWANLDKGKATIKQLPAGEYIVSARFADVRYIGKVTVKTGESAKVELKPVP